MTLRHDSITQALGLLPTDLLGGRQGRGTAAGLPFPLVGPANADAVLRADWRGRREILQPARDLVRAGVRITGGPEWLDEAAVQSALEGDPHERTTARGPGSHTALLGALSEWWALGEAEGGSVLIPVVEDGLRPWQPLDIGRIERVISWEVLDRWEITPHRRTQGGPVEYWLLAGVRDLAGALRSEYQIVHPSRVLPHWGGWMPPRWRAAFNGWGISRLELLADLRDGLARGDASLATYLERFHQDVIAIAELTELLDPDEGGSVAALVERLQALLAATRTIDCMILDGGRQPNTDPDHAEPGRPADTFTSANRPSTGVPEVHATLAGEWRKGSAMPAIVADGDAVGGLTSGDRAGEWRAWANQILAEDEATMTPALVWCLDVLFASREGPTQGRPVEAYTVEWNRIDADDPAAEAEAYEAEARGDEIYLAAGVLNPRTVRRARMVEGQRGRLVLEGVELDRDEDA